jgi:hypothetical protein
MFNNHQDKNNFTLSLKKKKRQTSTNQTNTFAAKNQKRKRNKKSRIIHWFKQKTSPNQGDSPHQTRSYVLIGTTMACVSTILMYFFQMNFSILF